MNSGNYATAFPATNLSQRTLWTRHNTAKPAWRNAIATGVCALGALLTGVVSANAMMADEDATGSLMAFDAGSEAFLQAPIVLAAPPLALAEYARAGFRAALSTRAHGVRGTVTIVDADTFRVDNFSYDGGGIAVYFILAATDDNAVFRNNRLVTDLNLLGTPFSGGSLTVDLPSGTTFDGYNAISLWCIPAGANFGSGTFAAPVPEPASASMLALGAMTLGLSLRRHRK